MSISRAPFRARAGAAPLKLYDIETQQPQYQGTFRARAGAAPLKRLDGRQMRFGRGHSAPARARPR